VQQRLTAVVGEDSYLVREGLVAVLMDGGIEVLSVAGDLDGLRDAYATEVFAAGNPRRAYLLKERLASPEFLIGAVRAVANGQPQVDPQVMTLLVRPEGAEPGLDRLSRRETEVLALLAEGLSNTAIAERLVLTTRAVEHHINSIFEKLDLHDPKTNRRVMATLVYTHGRD